jgi:hypothetical protein
MQLSKSTRRCNVQPCQRHCYQLRNHFNASDFDTCQAVQVTVVSLEDSQHYHINVPRRLREETGCIHRLCPSFKIRDRAFQAQEETCRNRMLLQHCTVIVSFVASASKLSRTLPCL